MEPGWDALRAIPPGASMACYSIYVKPVAVPEAVRACATGRQFEEAEDSWTSVVHPEDAGPAREGWMRARRSRERTGEAMLRLQDADGQSSWHRVRYIDLVDDPDAGVVVVTSEKTDIGPDRKGTQGRTWFRSSADFHMRLGENGRILEASPTVANVLGVVPQQLVGTVAVDIIHPDDQAAVYEAWSDLLVDRGGVRSIRQRVRTASGHWRWMESTNWNLLDAPEVGAVVAECRDINEQVAAEQALRASEEQFRTLAESFPTGVLLVTAEGQHIYSNRARRNMLGLADADDLDSALLDLIHPEDQDELVRNLAGRSAEEGPLEQTFRFIRADDGRVRHGFGMIQLLHDPDGKVSGAIGSFRDITEELHAEHEHQRLLQILEETSDCVVLLARGGGVFQANAAARRTFGEHIVGQSTAALIAPETEERIRAEALPEIIAGRPWRGEVELITADGRNTPMSILLHAHGEPTGPAGYISVTLRDITEQKSVEVELARQARRDPLTGLPNRLAIMERLADGQQAARRSGATLAVLFIDVDNLKVVNDGLGHSAGDELLRAMAHRLESGLRPDDVLGRFGGDEFIVICPNLTDGRAALAVARRILEVAGQTVQLPGTQVQLSASIGVAVDADGQEGPEDLIRDADTAMYEAKRRGKNRATVFDSVLREQVTNRLSLENDLRAALGTGELAVWFQPVVDTHTYEVQGAEGLVRWDHPRLGLIGPDDFVPLAEETGLIVPLGYEVLTTSLELGRRLANRFPAFRDLEIGINVSGRQFADPTCAERILELIGASGVPIENVMLELTESVLLDHLDDVDRSLHRLRDAGVQLALDDFGSGYSSLSYLRRYPVSVLKLDTSYTQRLTTEADTRIIAEAITTMARRLGLTVVAEGIETVEQLEVVCDLGIARAQGLLLGGPAPGQQLRPAQVVPRADPHAVQWAPTAERPTELEVQGDVAPR